MGKGSVADAAHDLIAVFYDSKAFRIGVIHKPGNVLPGHLWQLFLEQCLQSGKED